MTLPEVGAIQFLQPASFETQGRKQVSSFKSDEVGEHDNSVRGGQGVPSPVKDQVTLSKEAQELATSTSQSSKNNAYQQSPSPLDR